MLSTMRLVAVRTSYHSLIATNSQTTRLYQRSTSYEDNEINPALLAYPLSLSAFDGASYILTASAKITPNPDMEGTTLITIVKGDTLWGLAANI